MAVRKKLETRVQAGLPSTESKRTIHINREALTSLAQYGSPTKIFPFLIVIKRAEEARELEFDLPEELAPLPASEEAVQVPGLLDVERWLDSIDSFEDALFAAQIGSTIFARLPESLKKKITEEV